MENKSQLSFVTEIGTFGEMPMKDPTVQPVEKRKELEALRHQAKAQAWMNEGSAGKAVVDFMISKGE